MSKSKCLTTQIILALNKEEPRRKNVLTAIKTYERLVDKGLVKSFKYNLPLVDTVRKMKFYNING